MPALIATVTFNSLVALFLTVIGAGGPSLADNMIWSQSIGLVIAGMVLLALRANAQGMRRVLAVVGAVAGGALLGVGLALVLTGSVSSHGPMAWQAVFIGLFFGGIASTFFWLRERNAGLETALRERELARLEAEKRSVEAQLRMLQAQIEPHFLFNSLANVSALIAADPAAASRLLDALIRYLRGSLSRTRAEQGTLGDEVALLTAYLDVLKIRMGERLRYVFEIPPELLGAALPPMLLQPLVENAIRHGLEPKLAGGGLRIAARREDGRLLLSVADDGLGFTGTPGEGVGLSNIRARLAALFGPAARLDLRSGVGAGVTAVLEIPA